MYHDPMYVNVEQCTDGVVKHDRPTVTFDASFPTLFCRPLPYCDYRRCIVPVPACYVIQVQTAVHHRDQIQVQFVRPSQRVPPNHPQKTHQHRRRVGDKVRSFSLQFKNRIWFSDSQKHFGMQKQMGQFTYDRQNEKKSIKHDVMTSRDASFKWA